VNVGGYADIGKLIADIVNIDRIKINVRVPELCSLVDSMKNRNVRPK
jgi:hypothetical protein